jgi:hypothetical protein
VVSKEAKPLEGIPADAKLVGGDALQRNFHDLPRGNGTGVILEGRGGDDEFHPFNGDIALGGAGRKSNYVYTDRLPSGQQGNMSGSENRVLILGFDREDRLSVNGVEYHDFADLRHRRSLVQRAAICSS